MLHRELTLLITGDAYAWRVDCDRCGDKGPLVSTCEFDAFTAALNVNGTVSRCETTKTGVVVLHICGKCRQATKATPPAARIQA